MALTQSDHNEHLKSGLQDNKLLVKYVRHASEEAFHELVNRHIRLIYSTCLRELDDESLAEDATQIVFALLAQKANKLTSVGSLAGWLYITARYTSSSIRRKEIRRKRHENEFIKQGLYSACKDELVWNNIEPYLDDALMSLSKVDRDAVLLRFFEDLTYKEVAENLAITTSNAERRVARALEKMRKQFMRYGFTLSISSLITVLNTKSTHAVPLQYLSKVYQIGAPGGCIPPYRLIDTMNGAVSHITQHARMHTLRIAAGFMAALLIIALPSAVTRLPRQNRVVKVLPVTAVSAANPVSSQSSHADRGVSELISNPAGEISFIPQPSNNRSAAARKQVHKTHQGSDTPVISINKQTQRDDTVKLDKPASDNRTIRTINKSEPTSDTASPLINARRDQALLYKIVAIPNYDPNSLNYYYMHNSSPPHYGSWDEPVGLNDSNEVVYRSGDIYQWDGQYLSYRRRAYGLPRIQAANNNPMTPEQYAAKAIRKYGGKVIVKGQVGASEYKYDVDPDYNNAADNPIIATADNVPVVALDINNNGSVLGMCESGLFICRSGSQAAEIAVYPTHFTDLRIYLSGAFNDNGQVVAGVSAGSEPDSLPEHDDINFYWENNQVSRLSRMLYTGYSQSLPGTISLPKLTDIEFKPYAVNGNGGIVGRLHGYDPQNGEAVSAPVYWSNGHYARIRAFNDEAAFIPRGINNSNVIVGQYGVGGSIRAVIWKDGKAYDLNKQIPADSQWRLLRANRINNRGEIIGYGRYNGEPCGFLLIPQDPDAAAPSSRYAMN